MTKLKVENGMVGEGVGFDRIRRITGYLVGTLDRFNSAKCAEVKDRVIHDGTKEGCSLEGKVIKLEKVA